MREKKNAEKGHVFQGWTWNAPIAKRVPKSQQQKNNGERGIQIAMIKDKHVRMQARTQGEWGFTHIPPPPPPHTHTQSCNLTCGDVLVCSYFQPATKWGRVCVPAVYT